MKQRWPVVCGVVIAYLLGLGWGYVRLPWATIKHLHDYELVAHAEEVSYGPSVDLTPAQDWYLRRALPVTDEPVVPQLQIQVEWYAVVLARVKSGHYVGNSGAEGRDSVFFCFFGFWIPVYNISSVMV